MMRLKEEFYRQDVFTVAKNLVGKQIVCTHPDGGEIALRITETEAYTDQGDLACHATKGKTDRTAVMFGPGGFVYVYLVYGMHYMLNVVTGEENQAQAVLVRACENYPGPGKLTKHLGIDKSFYGEDLTNSPRIKIVDDGYRPKIVTAPRVGIDYAGEPWVSKPWRYIDDAAHTKTLAKAKRAGH